RNADRLKALDQVISEARSIEGDLSGVLIPGDLFHQKSTVEDRNALAPRLQALAALAPVVLTYGNHDVPGDLDIFAKLEAKWPIYVIDPPRVILFDTPSCADLASFALAHPNKGGLVRAGVEHDHLGQAAHALLEPVFMSAAAELEAAGAA